MVNMIHSAANYRMDMPIAEVFKICQGSMSFISIVLIVGWQRRMNTQTDCEFLDYASIIIMSQSFLNNSYIRLFFKRGIKLCVLC